MKIHKEHFASDFLASVVVFFVALPLCMGIAIASGVPPILGLISGIIGGLIIGPLAGVPLQVSGPAAGLAIMVFQFVEQFGLSSLLILGLVTAALQIAAGLLKLGHYFRAVSPALVKGMLGGIGALILISQLHVGLSSKPTSNGVENILALPSAFSNAMQGDMNTFFVLLICLAVIVAWSRFAKGKLKIVPAPLVGVITGIVLAAAFFTKAELISIPSNLLEGLNFAAFSHLPPITVQMITMALGIALVASVETLLSASAVDRMAKSDSDFDRELIAQGVGNGFAGLLGALPLTGVIVRSTANIQFGGKTWMSAFLHGIWLTLFVFLLPGLLAMIPMASLAAILVVIGIKLLDFPGVVKVFKTHKGEFFIYMVTITLIVTTDLLTGVAAGFVASLAVLLWEVTHLDVQTVEKEGETHLIIKGKASFLQLPKLIRKLPKKPGQHKIVVDLTLTYYVDHATKEELKSWASTMEESDTKVQVVFPANPKTETT